jgi:hypothetical protein
MAIKLNHFSNCFCRDYKESLFRYDRHKERVDLEDRVKG